MSLEQLATLLIVTKKQKGYREFDKTGFTHANFVGRFLKLSKQTKAKSRLNAMTSPILKNLLTVYKSCPVFAWILLEIFGWQNRRVQIRLKSAISSKFIAYSNADLKKSRERWNYFVKTKKDEASKNRVLNFDSRP